MKIMLATILLTLAACASNNFESDEAQQNLGDIAEVDAMISHCTIIFGNLIRGYASDPSSMEDVHSIALKLRIDNSKLSKILHMDSIAIHSISDSFEKSNEILYQLRSNAVKNMKNSECGDTADEYLQELLFLKPIPDPGQKIAFEYKKINQSAISYRMFLLLTLVAYLNIE